MCATVGCLKRSPAVVLVPFCQVQGRPLQAIQIPGTLPVLAVLVAAHEVGLSALPKVCWQLVWVPMGQGMGGHWGLCPAEKKMACMRKALWLTVKRTQSRFAIAQQVATKAP